MTIWFTLSLIILLALAIGTVIYSIYEDHSADQAAHKRFYELLEKNTGELSADRNWTKGMVRRMSRTRLFDWLPKIENTEITTLLKQAGWYSPLGRILFYLSTSLLPIVLFCVVLLIAFINNSIEIELAGQLFVVTTLGYLLPKYIIRYRANARRKQLAKEMPTAIHLLRMLFEAGLSIEHALRVLQIEGKLLTPVLSQELYFVLRRLDSGLTPADALSEMAMPLDVNELTDTVAIIKQVSRDGGNIRDTLVKFAKLMEERQMSALREYVNVLSGKMSIVMMVFLFPALLIFLAGPGLIALAKGLTGGI